MLYARSLLTSEDGLGDLATYGSGGNTSDVHMNRPLYFSNLSNSKSRSPPAARKAENKQSTFTHANL